MSDTTDFASLYNELTDDALFCLEYAVSPYEIDHELRIYQNDDVNVYNPTGQEIMDICDRIIRFNKLLIQHRKQEV